MKAPRDVDGLSGSVILPCGIQSHTLERRDLSKHKHLGYRIIDPQMYYSGLTASMCRKACANLATYGWFNAANLPKFDSSEFRQRDYSMKLKANIHRIWPKAMASNANDIYRLSSLCIGTQKHLGCDAILLPTSLIIDQGEDLDSQIRWLDLGLESADCYQCESPVYATIAISDTALRSIKPEQNVLLDVIIDQITSRKFTGVYLVIEQTSESGYYCMHPNTVGSLLRLVWGFKLGGIKDVILGPMGLLGYLSLAAGADAWTAGWYRGERRIKMTDMESDDNETKMSSPTYYSHPLASEIHTGDDLDAVAKLGIFETIKDITLESRGLIEALQNGRSAKSVPEWKYSPSNVTAARAHFSRSVASATKKIAEMNTSDLVQHIHNWIANADELASKIKEERNCKPRTELNHQANWLEAFVAFRKYAGI